MNIKHLAAAAVIITTGGVVAVSQSASAHHYDVSTRCDSETGETIVSLNIVYPSGSASFGGESLPLNTPLERRITSDTTLTIDGPGSAYDTTTTVASIDDCSAPEPPVDICTTAIPGPGSVAQWISDNGYENADHCFDYEAFLTECGADGSVTLQVQPEYATGPFRLIWNEGDGIDLDNAQAFPATFAEDYNGGSVTISYYIVGPENDWFIGSSLPNYWGGIYGTLVVDTDCEDPPVETTEPPATTTQAPTTTTPQETTTTWAPTTAVTVSTTPAPSPTPSTSTPPASPGPTPEPQPTASTSTPSNATLQTLPVTR